MGQLFNACDYLLDRRLAAGDGERIALAGAAGEMSYSGLHELVCRTAAGLRSIGLAPEQRLLMLMADTPEFVTVYLAAMRIGAIRWRNGGRLAIGAPYGNRRGSDG